MEVILKEDVDSLGHRGDVVKVANGYGRNYLLPQRLAIEATVSNKAVIVQMKDSAVRKAAKDKATALEQADKQGFEIDRRKIQLSEPLKQLGEFHVPVKLFREVSAHVKVTVKSDDPNYVPGQHKTVAEEPEEYIERYGVEELGRD